VTIKEALERVLDAACAQLFHEWCVTIDRLNEDEMREHNLNWDAADLVRKLVDDAADLVRKTIDEEGQQ
jgi:hypothetical protein